MKREARTAVVVWTARGTVIGAFQQSGGGEAPLCTHCPATTTARRCRSCRRSRYAPSPLVCGAGRYQHNIEWYFTPSSKLTMLAMHEYETSVLLIVKKKNPNKTIFFNRNCYNKAWSVSDPSIVTPSDSTAQCEAEAVALHA